MASVMLFLVVYCVSLVYGIYQTGQFIYKGDVAYSKRLPALKEIFAPSDVSTLPFCAIQCRMYPQCKAIEMCEQNESKLCRLCNFTNPSFSANDTDSCRHLELDNVETESCSKEEYTASIVHTCKEILYNTNRKKLYTNGKTILSGVYSINIDNKSTDVWCDMKTDGGGWTVIQRRQSGKTDFSLSWNEYKRGFGNPCDEYWIGNDALNILTTTRNVTLRIDLEQFNGQKGYMTFSTFGVGNEAEEYRISLSGHNGTISTKFDFIMMVSNNCLRDDNGQPFSTTDKDNCECFRYTDGSAFSTKDSAVPLHMLS